LKLKSNLYDFLDSLEVVDVYPCKLLVYPGVLYFYYVNIENLGNSIF